jgi:diguanylate cyclase (GGDEF)-like protein/PAS domain S-box-containing protein
MDVTVAVDGGMILGEQAMTDVEWRRLAGLGGAFGDAITGMAILDLEGRFQAVNLALCQMLGRTESELVGMSPHDITHPGDRSVSAATLRRLLSGEAGTDQTRKRYLRPDGSVVVTVRTTTALRDEAGHVVGLFTQVVDVTETAEAQESLRRSERRFRALVAHASELTVLVDVECRIVYASPASHRLLGRAPAALEGLPALDLIHPDDLERAERAFKDHLGSARTAARSEALRHQYRVLHADGSWRHAEVVATNLLEDPDVEALVLNVRDITEQRTFQDQLEASEQRLRALVGSSWDVITLHDADGRYLYCSPAITPMLGYQPDELIGTNPFALMHPDDAIAATMFEEAVTGNESSLAVQYRIRHRDGSWRWLESTAHSRLDDPAVAGVVITTRDVTVRRRRAAQQEAVAALSGEALSGGPIEDLFDRAVHLVAGVLGVGHCSVLKESADGMLRVVARHGPVITDGAIGSEVSRWAQSLSAQAIEQRQSVVWKTVPADLGPSLPSGGLRSGAAAVIADGARPYGALVVYSTEPDDSSRDDISFLEAAANVIAAALARRRVEGQLRLRALHDNLTGLPNRVLLRDRLDAALAHLDRHSRSLAVLFIDTDDFKLVNDSLGHAAGDQVVVTVAERIVGLTRRADTVARFGGDEFVVLCEDTDAATAASIAERIRMEVAAPIELAGRTVVVTASVGIAVTSDASISPDDLLAQADTAMYAAKHAGKDRSAVFDLRMRAEVTERLDATTGLRRALADDELLLFYQPVVRTDTGEVVGSEALLRWQHPSDGLLGPDRFIDYAEGSGLIVPIGAWVIDSACRQAVEWAERGFSGSVSINVSGRQLSESDIVATVDAALAGSGADPRQIWLEVTENAVMCDLARAATVLEELRSLGVRIGMDDFGTGHSSLSQLARLPFDFVKIDRSFVQRFAQDLRAAALLQAIAALCRTLDLAVIAEGVETEQQLRVVRELGIPQIQGFLFGRPVPPDVFGARWISGIDAEAAP